MERKFASEDVLLGIFIAMFIFITLYMGVILFGKESYPADKTLKVLSSSDPSALKRQKSLDDAYMKLHPDIKVEIIAFPWENIWQKLEFLMVANIPPDVAGMEQPKLPRFIHMGVVEPLDEWIRNDPDFNIEDLYIECVNEGNWDGKQYALPTDFSPVCLWYNKTLFDREGLAYPTRDWTRQDLVAAGKRLTKDFDGDGISDQYGFYTNNNHWNRYPAWIWMTGGEFMTADWKKSTFDSPKVVEGIKWLASLALTEGIQPKMSFLANIGSPNLFMSGQLAMMAETRYFNSNFYLERNADKIKQFSFDVCELPHDVKRASCFVVDEMMMPSILPPERKKMAWDYLKFTADKQGQEVIAQEPGGLPVRREQAEEVVLRPDRKIEHERAFIDSVTYARYFYWPFPADEAFASARSDLYGVWYGRLEAEAVCKKSAAAITKAVEDFYAREPNAHLPMPTKWIPLAERAGIDPDKGVPRYDAPPGQ